MITFDFNYNVTTRTINHINEIDYTYHVNNTDYLTKHAHSDYWEFTILLKGELDNYRNGVKERINKNTLFISTTKDVHYFKAVKNSSVTLINIIARASKLKEMIELLYPGLYDDIVHGKKIFNVPNELLEIVENNLNKVNSLPESDWMVVNNIVKSTTISLINYIYLESLNIVKSNESWEIELISLQNTQEFLTYSVNDLCEKLGYSRTQLNRLFKQHFGLSPHDYLLNSKMDYAASLLVYTDTLVSDIATTLGYANLSQFNNNFKDRFHDTPQKYRKRSHNIQL